MRTMVELQFDAVIRRDSHGGYYIRVPKRTAMRLMHQAGLVDHFDGWPVGCRIVYGGSDE